MSKIAQEGFLTSLAEKCLSGTKLDNASKLRTPALERIATYFGHLSKKADLYDILFNGENERVELDGDRVNTHDLRSFVILDHSVTRGYFWKPDVRATTDTSVNHGVPLALKGARRLYNKSYMSWIDWSAPEKCDVFLPYGLNSYEFDPESGQLVRVETEQTKRGGAYGLLNLLKKEIYLSAAHVHKLRLASTSYLTNTAPGKVSLDEEDEVLEELFNNCSKRLRCLLLQGWIYGPASRHSDMITDTSNWDNFAPSVDKSFAGVPPSTTQLSPGLARYFT